jgi:hypothetical protein
LLVLLVALAAAVRAGIPPNEVAAETPVYEPVRPIPEIRERWNFDFSWSGIPVAKVSLTGGEASGATPRVLDIYVRGETNGFLDLFWRYRLNAHGTIRLDPYRPGSYLAEESIKRKLKVTRIAFDDDWNIQTSRTKKGIVHAYEFRAPNLYDILSTVYLVLNLSYEQDKPLRFNTLTGTARFLVTITPQARERVEVGGTYYDAWRLQLLTEKLTDPEESDHHSETLLWVSAERPRRMLKAQSKLFIGSVYAELTSVDALDHWPDEPPPVALGVSEPTPSELRDAVRR